MARGRGAIFLALFPSLCAFLLHFLTPAGLLGSHHALVIILPTIQCLLFSIISNESKFRLCCIVSLATLTLLCVSILFGAHPLRFWDNLCWSYLVAGITCTPAAHLIGTETRHWTRVFIERRFTCESDWIACLGSFGTVLGAWVGAFPILLDWNRAWQVWPIPCSVGALFGNFSGYVGAYILFQSKYYKTF